MLTVACVLSEGSKRTYRPDHVERLSGMVEKYLQIPYSFVCIDDSPYPGWWAKISLFEPGRFEGRVLYLDLDVTVVDDLAPLAQYPLDFVAIRDYIRPTVNSSVMSWEAGVADRIFENFTPSVMDRLPGDQDWITEQMSAAVTFPRRWCPSYRESVQRGAVPKAAKVVVFHGFPNPWDVPEVKKLA